jgi:hypothetical protein
MAEGSTYHSHFFALARQGDPEQMGGGGHFSRTGVPGPSAARIDTIGSPEVVPDPPANPNWD